MRNLQIIGNVPQVRRENNFGEYAEEAVIIEEQPKVKKENPHFLEANTLEVTMQHLKEDCITPDRKSTRLNSSHRCTSRMPSSA